MTIPTNSNYPDALDTNINLFQVNDGQRVVLAEDYQPGDTSISVTGDISLFDSTGFITLTDQCAEPKLRAISFYYGSKTTSTFDQLEILPGFTDVGKPYRLTNVTQNVMAEHHNLLKDALIQIEEFAGKKGETGIKPLQGTVEQRVNYIRKIALSPKAWFSVDKTIGLAPLSVVFTNQSFRLGTDGTSEKVSIIWDFGDNTSVSYVSIITAESLQQPVSTTLPKIYTSPGIYTVSLTVENDFGSDTVTFNDLITSRFIAPEPAVIGFLQSLGQSVSSPFPSYIRSTTNSVINVVINPNGLPNDIIPNTNQRYTGEIVDNSNNPIDPIINYTWFFSDDLTHSNATSAKAVFSIGGVYDLILRADTLFGAYRITEIKDAFDIIESTNLWLWSYATNSNSSVKASEFGILSETFKTAGATLSINNNDSFLSPLGQLNYSQIQNLFSSNPSTYNDQLTSQNFQNLKEFHRNNGFAQYQVSSSGSQGSGLLYWASGRNTGDSVSIESIKFSQFNGFFQTYTSSGSYPRQWNWTSFSSPKNLYFLYGNTFSDPSTQPTLNSDTNKNQLTFNFNSISPGLVGNPSVSIFDATKYRNGADELMKNNQSPTSVYRSAWYQDSGYIVRNQGNGQFFRMLSFYKTSGTVSNPFEYITKLSDMGGSTKQEGQLVSLSLGVYFFNNSGAISAFNPISGIWATGGPGASSTAFRSLQDSSVVGFDNNTNTLLAASDNDHLVYLSYDYSPNAFIKFNEIDTTFRSLVSRPTNPQWQMSIF